MSHPSNQHRIPLGRSGTHDDIARCGRDLLGYTGTGAAGWVVPFGTKGPLEPTKMSNNILPTTTDPVNVDDPLGLDQTTTTLANMSIDSPTPDNDSDSTGSIPDLEHPDYGSTLPNWRGPAYLAQRAFRDAFGDRATHSGYQGGPMGNFRRGGGVPYPVQGGRGLDVEVINDLIWRLQRVERALRGLAEHQYWLPRRF
ncbi:hypothetical protein B0H14DRAFT_2628673 [Mycena olivaceomarginata]|nr:hypothetical protein B0H14DRAFT_2628673 [Mycena olivaceomarginata]